MADDLYIFNELFKVIEVISNLDEEDQELFIKQLDHLKMSQREEMLSDLRTFSKLASKK